MESDGYNSASREDEARCLLSLANSLVLNFLHPQQSLGACSARFNS